MRRRDGSRRYGHDAQEDVPPEPDATPDEDPPSHGDPHEANEGDDGPDVPARLHELPQLLLDDVENLAELLHARDVRDDEQDADHERQPERHVGDELSERVEPADAAIVGGSASWTVMMRCRRRRRWRW